MRIQASTAPCSSDPGRLLGTAKTIDRRSGRVPGGDPIEGISMTRCVIRSLLPVLGLLVHPAFAGETLLVLASQAGDYIGGGQQRVIST